MNTIHRTCRLFLLPLALVSTATAFAQSPSSLEQENQRLRAQIQAMQQANGNAQPPDASTWSDSQISARVASIRVGQTGATGRMTNVTTAITLSNIGSTPLALNYLSDSLSITDNHGYRYRFRNGSYYGNVKGLPVATRQHADTRQVLMPGQSSTVTFLTEHSLKKGQTPGSHFDISATFAAYVDEGQGRIRQVQAFPVFFTNVRSGSGSGHQPSEPGGKEPGRVARRLLEGLIK